MFGRRPGPRRDGNGWTVFTPTADVYYVASAANGGSDTNDGLAPTDEGGGVGPLLTLVTAFGKLTNGQPDWIVLRAGDTWTNEKFWNGSNAFFTKGGLSADEPMLISSYDVNGNIPARVGERPIIKYSPQSDIIAQDGIFRTGGMVGHADYVAIVGLNFYCHVRDYTSGDYDKSQSVYKLYSIRLLSPTNWFLVEDCKFGYFPGGVALSNNHATQKHKTVTFRRNVCHNTYPFVDLTGDPDHSSGFYCEGIKSLLMEENIFYMNGWDETLQTPETVTLTVASPCVVTWANNKFNNNQTVKFLSNGDTLPTELAFNTTYYVVNNETDGAGKFRLALTAGGADINTSGSQSGTHKLIWQAPEATGFNHSVYILQENSAPSTQNSPVVFRRNISIKASSHGVQANPGGHVYDNLISHCAHGILAGKGSPASKITQTPTYVHHNVLVSLTDIQNLPISGSDQAGIGIAFDRALGTFSVTDNIICNTSTATGVNELGMNIGASVNRVTVTDNVFYDMTDDYTDQNGTNTFSNNLEYANTTGNTFTAPTKTLLDYDSEVLGGPGTLAHFASELILQSRVNWRAAYTANVINNWFRANFDRDQYLSDE
jgi:hypothetical protein